jgi:site-specific DNA recombinase
MSASAATIRKSVIYCRVSDPKQVREGHGLTSQETRCREYAARCGYEVVEVFSEDMSGKIAQRPGILEVLSFLKRHRAEEHVVIIDDLSRLARDIESYKQLRRAIKAAKGKLESPSIQFGEDSDSVLIENLLASVAQHQREKNAEQTRNRMRARAQNGYWVFFAPVGYRYEKVAGHGKMLVRDEPCASIAKEALLGYRTGRFETPVEVKRFLESQPAWPKDRKGEVHPERITELLTRPVYAGFICNEGWGLNFVPAKHEALITLGDWQAIQERRNGSAKAPARKDLKESFPLRGFVSCGYCGEALTACWSTGRSARYPYYLCDTKGCPDYRKSTRKEKLEGEFEQLLTELQPTETLFNLAFYTFRDLWNAKVERVRGQAATLEQDIRVIAAKIERLVDKLVDATSDAVIAGCEKRIRDLEAQKALAQEKIANCGRPLASFDETYRTAFDFLANPWKLWRSPRIEDRRAVLKLVFAEKLPYVRNEGYRTAKISMPFKLIGDLKMQKTEMVPRRGLEPPRLAALVPETSASTNSAIWAGGAHVSGVAGSVNAVFGRRRNWSGRVAGQPG